MTGSHANHGEVYALVMTFLVILPGLAVPTLLVFLRRRYSDACFSRIYDDVAWIALPAVIESAKVERLAPSGEHGPRYSADIKYRYEYGGASYVASTICRSLTEFSSLSGVLPKHADRLKSILPAGTQVTAFVDKLNPGTATLSIQDAVYSGKSKPAIYAMAVLLFFSMVGLLSFLFVIVYLWRY